MPPDTVDLTSRTEPSQLPELMDQPCSPADMRACLRDLARVNTWFLGYRPTLKWLDSLHLEHLRRPIRILDVGCGYGDTLRKIEAWAHRQSLPVELIGLDLNPDTIAIAAAASPGSHIRWVAGDVFALTLEEPVDLVISALFTHHLDDRNVIRFLRLMEQATSLGWFVNDLSRARTPYHLFGWFARFARLHRFVRHDGPVSFARAFTPADWQALSRSAGLAASEYELQAFAPARLCVSRRKRR